MSTKSTDEGRAAKQNAAPTHRLILPDAPSSDRFAATFSRSRGRRVGVLFEVSASGPIETFGFLYRMGLGEVLAMRLMAYEELVEGWDASIPEPNLPFLVSDVPAGLHALIPYAQVFGITDDGYRSDLLRRTPRSIALHVRSAVLAHDEALSAWLMDVEANNSFTEASHLFIALLIAAESIFPDRG